MTTALLTDHYELTMLQGARAAGTADRQCVFELFARRLPDGRRYGVVAGVGRALEAIQEFRFDDADLAYLAEHRVVDEETLAWLADYRFSGDVWGYPEGEMYFPGSPVLVAAGGFAECVLLETVLLSIYNHDSAIASAASRMTGAAGDRPCIEMGSRRTHEQAAVAAARAAYVAGFQATSNLEAGRRYGVPTTGTAAHAFTLLHDTERQAFEAQLAALGEETTLLVDTYDVMPAVRLGVELTGGRLGAVRLDSGDLGALAEQVRELLDSLGATDTRIIVTSDLDEWQIAALASAPVERLRRRYVAGHRQRPPDLRVRLQAGQPGDVERTRRAAAAGRQEEQGQDQHRWPQAGAASTDRRCGGGRGDRRSMRPLAAITTTASSWSPWCAGARSSGHSGWTTPASGMPGRWPNCRWTP